MELPEIISITRELRAQSTNADGRSYHDVLATKSADDIRALGEAYIARTRIQRKSTAPFFIDKMPNNFFHVGLIHLILPNANHRCAPASAGMLFLRVQAVFRARPEFQLWTRRSRALLPRLRRADGALRQRASRARASRDLRAHGRRHRTRSAAAARLLRPAVRRRLPALLRERAARAHGQFQAWVRRPIYREGVDHWRHFEPWLSPLKAALGDVLEHYPDPPATMRADISWFDATGFQFLTNDIRGHHFSQTCWW